MINEKKTYIWERIEIAMLTQLDDGVYEDVEGLYVRAVRLLPEDGEELRGELRGVLCEVEEECLAGLEEAVGGGGEEGVRHGPEQRGGPPGHHGDEVRGAGGHLEQRRDGGVRHAGLGVLQQVLQGGGVLQPQRLEVRAQLQRRGHRDFS